MSVFSKVVGAAVTLGSIAGSGNTRATLVPESFGVPVVFSYNPKRVKVHKRVRGDAVRGSVPHATTDTVTATGNRCIELEEATVTGLVSTQSAIDQLLAWSTPTSSETFTINGPAASDSALDLVDGMARLAGNPLGSLVSSTTSSATLKPGSDKAATVTLYELPALRFVWGVGGPVGAGARVVLEKVSVSIERFDWTGMPVWAKFNLTLVLNPKPPAFTNPTSGGPPGRRRHRVTAGENVVGIANRMYGTPHAWRAVAAANGLDDPLRVRPGRLLTLPGPDGLTGGSS